MLSNCANLKLLLSHTDNLIGMRVGIVIPLLFLLVTAVTLVALVVAVIRYRKSKKVFQKKLDEGGKCAHLLLYNKCDVNQFVSKI